MAEREHTSCYAWGRDDEDSWWHSERPWEYPAGVVEEAAWPEPGPASVERHTHALREEKDYFDPAEPAEDASTWWVATDKPDECAWQGGGRRPVEYGLRERWHDHEESRWDIGRGCASTFSEQQDNRVWEYPAEAVEDPGSWWVAPDRQDGCFWQEENRRPVQSEQRGREQNVKPLSRLHRRGRVFLSTAGGRARSRSRVRRAVCLLGKEEWKTPRAFASGYRSRCKVRVMAKNLMAKLREGGLGRALFLWGDHMWQMHGRPPGLPEPAWEEVSQWLFIRRLGYTLLGRLPLQALWGADPDCWPQDLRIGKLLNPELRLPQKPPADSEEESWRYYPLHQTPPNLYDVGPQITPQWGPGWQLQYHGTSVYGASQAMCCGEVHPSRESKLFGFQGYKTVGAVKTTESFAAAVSHGIAHYFPGNPCETRKHLWVTRMVLLVAIRADAKVPPCATPSSLASCYVMGLCVGLMTVARAVSYSLADERLHLTWGYDISFEAPFARPAVSCTAATA